MDYQLVLMSGLILAVLALIYLAVRLLVVLRRVPERIASDNAERLSRLSESQNAKMATISERQEVLAQQLKPFVGSSRPVESAMSRLSFAESLDSERFAQVNEEASVKHLNGLLLSRAADGIVLTASSLRLKASRVEMIVSASMDGQKLLAEGKAYIPRHKSGRLLSMLSDSSGKNYIEHMKGVPTAKTMSKLASLSAAIVGAAHVVSGADIARRLRQLDGKVDLLLAYRRIDQSARLERIYTSAKRRDAH